MASGGNNPDIPQELIDVEIDDDELVFNVDLICQRRERGLEDERSDNDDEQLTEPAADVPVPTAAELEQNSASGSDDDEEGMENQPIGDTGEERVWRDMQSNTARSRRYEVPLFDHDSAGVNENIPNFPDLKSAWDYYLLFCTPQFLLDITFATNTYAANERRTNPNQHKMAWSPVSTKEMQDFLGLTYLMGLIYKPRLKDYWSTTAEMASPFFRTVMKRDRFIQILRYLNFPRRAGPNDASTVPAAEGAQRRPDGMPRPTGKEKVNWIFHHLNTVAKSVYNPRRELAVDESMVAHKGRTAHLQYMAKKPTKWGLKVWALAESASGYVLQVLPHFSKLAGERPKRLYEDIVFKLLQSGDCLNKNHHVYFDNLYTSVPMFADLSGRFGTYCCGTLRKNRKYLPKDLMNDSNPKLRERGSAIFKKSGNLVVCAWRDRRVVQVLSSIHGSQLDMCQRTMRGDDGKYAKRPLPCPVIVRRYSRHMGGVDLCDQLWNYYAFGRKSRKWTKKMFFFALEIFKLNSFLMYNSRADKKLSLYDFTLQLVRQMVNRRPEVEATNRTQSGPVLQDRLTNRCMPRPVKTRGYCQVCRDRTLAGKATTKRQSRIVCSICNVHLCLDKCFEIFHMKEDYIY